MPELRVGDEAAVLAPLLLGEQQVPQHGLQAAVAEPDLVDQRGGARGEQVGAQCLEPQPAAVVHRRHHDAVRSERLGRVALVDQPEQHPERLVEVGAGAGGVAGERR